MLIVFAAFIQTALAPLPDVPSRSEDIIVLAKTTAEAQRLLEACLVDHCPPPREIKAALVYASRQMVDGNYAAARNTLLDSRRRNGRFDKDYPVEVSDLHRALNRLSNLDGRQDSARISAVDATDALRAGSSPDDPAMLRQRLMSGNQLAREGRVYGASDIYNDVAATAHKSGEYGVEAQALFNGAALYVTLASINPIYTQTARRWIDRIEKRREPEFKALRRDLDLMNVSVAALSVSPEARAKIYSEAKPVESGQAILLAEPPLQAVSAGAELASKHGGSGVPEWADVGFWVRPDGSVGNLAIVKQSDPEPGSWLKTKLDAVRERRYAPLLRPANARGLYRVERFSMVHNFLPTTGTRVPRRSSQGEIDTMDLTPVYSAPSTSTVAGARDG